MDTRRTLVRTVEVLLLVGAFAIVAGAILGQPILVGYVQSGSMSPTLESGDGFVAIPAAIAGPVEEGDVVVFRAEEVEGGGLTTHRVVGETDQGYLTRGDGNPFTDQDGPEPPVKDAQIVAEVLQFQGQVVPIPELGTAVGSLRGAIEWVQRGLANLFNSSLFLGTQGVAYVLLVFLGLWYVVETWRERQSSNRTRDRSRGGDGMDARRFVAALTVLLVVVATAAMVIPSGTDELGVVSSVSDSPGARVIPAGTTETKTVSVANSGFVPVVAVAQPASDGVEIDPEMIQLSPRSRANVTLAITAPPQTGYYRRFVTTHQYLGILPASLIGRLHAVHPWLPLALIDAMLAVPFYVVGIRLVGTGRIPDRTRTGARSFGTRLRRAVRDRY